MGGDRLRIDESRLNAFLNAPEPAPVEDAFEDDIPEEPEKPKRSRSRKRSDKPSSPFEEEQDRYFVKEFPDKIHSLSIIPDAFVEPDEAKPYPEDSFDKVVPPGGFVSDYVNACRGIETPTLHLMWSALWTVSSALKREAWIRWYPKKLWPNLYVMLVAPPALCRKSSGMDIGVELLRQLPSQMGSTLDAYGKESKFVSSKCTPEGLVMMLEPDKRVFLDQDAGKMHAVNKGSQVVIAVSELPTFLGRQQYNLGMVNLLLDLYDCKDHDDEITRGRGIGGVEQVYTTFIGAVTPEGLRLAIPEEAFGGGFMSRVIIAYQDRPSKIYPFPRAIPGYPTVDDLLPKLAWIANVAKGEYYFTEEAEDVYEQWYMKFKTELFASTAERFEEYRKDTLLLKVACLLRIQEYRPGFDITAQNIIDAERLLSATVRKSKAATEDVGAGEYKKQMNVVRRVLTKAGEIERRMLLKRISVDGVSAARLNEILSQLFEEEFLEIELQGHLQLGPSSQGAEKYRLIGDRSGTN